MAGQRTQAALGFAMARIDRANAGLSLLLERLHAIERVRVDGDAGQQVGDDVREGLLMACRGLAEYVDVSCERRKAGDAAMANRYRYRWVRTPCRSNASILAITVPPGPAQASWPMSRLTLRSRVRTPRLSVR